MKLKNTTKTTKTLIASLIFLSALTTNAMADEAKKAEEPPVKLEFYIDSYFSTDNDMGGYVAQKNLPAVAPGAVAPAAPGINDIRKVINAIGFRKNEINLNTAQVTASTAADWYRGRFTLAYGTIPQQSWTPMEYLPVQEANAGIKVIDNLWVDGGVFLTHVGGESLLPKYNWLSSLALCTMFQPFFQSGLKVSYKPVDSFEAALHLLNGYGIISDNNSDKTLGWLFSYSPMSSLSISYNGTVGNEKPTGTAAAIRFYNDVNVSYQVTDNFGLKGMFDFATESSNFYYAGALSARYAFNPSVSVSLRGETISDPKGMVSASLEGYGVTLGTEYKPTENSYIRLEGRQLMMGNNDANKLFTDSNGNKNNSRLEGMISAGVSF